MSVAGLGAAVLFILYVRSVTFPWAPAVIYSTVGTLVAIAAYDLARLAFPTQWFATLGLYEHVVKLIGAYSALYVKAPERRLTLILLGNSGGLSEAFPMADGDVMASAFAKAFVRIFIP